MRMRIPGTVWTALIVALIAGLKALAKEFQGMPEDWAPYAIVVLMAAVKALDVWLKQSKEQVRIIGERQRSKWAEWLLG